MQLHLILDVICSPFFLRYEYIDLDKLVIKIILKSWPSMNHNIDACELMF